MFTYIHLLLASFTSSNKKKTLINFFERYMPFFSFICLFIGLAINLSNFRQLTPFGVFCCFLVSFGVSWRLETIKNASPNVFLRLFSFFFVFVRQFIFFFIYFSFFLFSYVYLCFKRKKTLKKHFLSFINVSWRCLTNWYINVYLKIFLPKKRLLRFLNVINWY
jgi:hypothetical protein